MQKLTKEQASFLIDKFSSESLNSNMFKEQPHFATFQIALLSQIIKECTESPGSNISPSLSEDLRIMAKELEIVKHVLNELTLGSNAALAKICNGDTDAKIDE